MGRTGIGVAVRGDETGQAGLEFKVGGFDEGLKPDPAQPRELHTGVISIPQAAAAKGIVEGSRPLWRVIRAASARRMNRRRSKRNRAVALSRPWPVPERSKRRLAAAPKNPAGRKNPYPSLR